MGKKYSSGSLVVEKMESEEKILTNDTASKSVVLDVEQAMDMLAGYQMSEHAVVDFKEDSGVCLLCGKSTNSAARCICYDCHGKHMKPIYEKAKESIRTGKKTFEYEY